MALVCSCGKRLPFSDTLLNQRENQTLNMKNFKKLKIYFTVILIILLLPAQFYAGKKKQNHSKASTTDIPKRASQRKPKAFTKPLPPPPPSSPAIFPVSDHVKPTSSPFSDFNSLVAAASDFILTTTAPPAPVLSFTTIPVHISQIFNSHNIINNIFNIRIFYNFYNDCITLRVDPTSRFQESQKLEEIFLINYLENNRQTIARCLKQVGLSGKLSQDIFDNFELVCIDSRIKTRPSQILNPPKWIILQQRDNADIYINKDHLAADISPEDLNEITFFALYI